MTALKFSVSDLERVVAHSIAAPEQLPFGAAAFDAPMILLVKDEGVYIMSNGIPYDPAEPSSERRFVVYAEGYNPTKDAEAIDKSFDMSGDDFVEPISAEEVDSMLKTAKDAGFKSLVVRLTEDSLTFAVAL